MSEWKYLGRSEWINGCMSEQTDDQSTGMGGGLD